MVASVRISGGHFTGVIVEDVPGTEILGAGFKPLCHARYPHQNLYRDHAECNYISRFSSEFRL